VRGAQNRVTFLILQAGTLMLLPPYEGQKFDPTLTWIKKTYSKVMPSTVKYKSSEAHVGEWIFIVAPYILIINDYVHQLIHSFISLRKH
jgi:hypothetical protein